MFKFDEETDGYASALCTVSGVLDFCSLDLAGEVYITPVCRSIQFRVVGLIDADSV